MRSLIVALCVASALAVPHLNMPGYNSMYLASLPRSPICWNTLTRCDTTADCAVAVNSDCNTCYGAVPGQPRSGMCGVPPEMVHATKTTVPEQVRIAQGADPTSMTITWVTTAQTDSSLQISSPSSTTPETWTTVVGTSRNYTAYCHGSNTPDYAYVSGYIHIVKIDNLEPNSLYTYRIDANTTRTFRTLPAVGDLSSPHSFGVIGDLGQTAYSAQTIQHVQNDPSIGIMLHAGDMSYADCDHKRWDSWGLMVDPVASKIPYMVCAGNHEIEMDVVEQTTFMAYKNRFAMPEVKPTDDTTQSSELPHDCAPSDYSGHFDFGNSFYSFEFGGVHAIVLNSYTAATVGSNQYEWLYNDLSKINRTRTPFVVAMFHGPWYNTNQAHHDEHMSLTMKANMEELFNQYHVNAAFSGHVHAYERTYEVYRNETMAPGGSTMYFVLGDAGNREGHADSYLQKADWSAYRNGNQYGHARVTVFNATMAKFEWMRNIDSEATVADSVWLINDDAAWNKKQHRTSG